MFSVRQFEISLRKALLLFQRLLFYLQDIIFVVISFCFLPPCCNFHSFIGRRTVVRVTNMFENAQYKSRFTERGGSVVTHETRIREVPGSNPGADQPDWGFFVVFLNHEGKCWVRFSLPRSIWPLFIKFIYHKIDSVTLTIETLTTHNNRNTQPSGTHPKILDAIWPRCWGVSK